MHTVLHLIDPERSKLVTDYYWQIDNCDYPAHRACNMLKTVNTTTAGLARCSSPC